MTLASMTTGNLYQGPDPEDTDEAPDGGNDMGRYRISPKIPQATLVKVGLKVGDLVPEDWDPEQVARWKRRGYLIVEATPPKETAQGGEPRETRGGGPQWPLKMNPTAYLARHPDGKHAVLARKLTEE